MDKQKPARGQAKTRKVISLYPNWPEYGERDYPGERGKIWSTHFGGQ